MSTPTITADYETGPRRMRACQVAPPNARIWVEFAYGDHTRALEELRTAYEDVKAQIESTGPGGRTQPGDPDVSGDFTDSPRALLDEA